MKLEIKNFVIFPPAQKTACWIALKVGIHQWRTEVCFFFNGFIGIMLEKSVPSMQELKVEQ